MRKSSLVLIAIAALLIVVPTAANAVLRTWTVVQSPGAYGVWPNEVNSENRFETDTGLLGRVVINWLPTTNPLSGGLGTDVPVLTGTIRNACELAPSYPCDASNPPAFLLSGNPHEGPQGSGSGDECNVRVVACNTVPIPSAAHEGGVLGPKPFTGVPVDGDIEGIGSYSYLALHTQPSTPGGSKGKGISFFSGSYTVDQEPYTCNDCPPIGRGKDAAGLDAKQSLSNTTIGSIVTPQAIALWTTQATPGAGHSRIVLKAVPNQGAGEFPPGGQVNQCGGGITFQTLETFLCGTGVTFSIPNQKVTNRTYSMSSAAWASFDNGGVNERKCSPPDCYVEKVIMNAASAQTSGAATAVQMQIATSVLPPNAFPIPNATVDSVLFYYTTDQLDLDGDGLEDAVDACPNDFGEPCRTNSITAALCPAGQVFCADNLAEMNCVDAFLCNQRIDVSGGTPGFPDCFADTVDQNYIASQDAGGSPLGVGSPAFNSFFPIGAFDP